MKNGPTFSPPSRAQTKRFSDSTRVTGFGILMYNAAVSLPLCLVGATLRGEWAYIAAFQHVESASFWASLTFASFLGCLMTYVAFLSTTVNSPLGKRVWWSCGELGPVALLVCRFRTQLRRSLVMSRTSSRHLWAPLLSTTSLRRCIQSPVLLCHSSAQQGSRGRS